MAWASFILQAARWIMSEAEQLSLIIGEIYDTTFDPQRWPTALESITTYMRGITSAFALQEFAVGGGQLYYSWGNDPEYTDLYFKKYVKINPSLVPIALRVNVGEVCSISTVVPYGEFVQSQLYKEWAKPQNYGDATVAVIEKSATCVAHLITVHHESNSPSGDETRQRMRHLVPHVLRAVAIAKIIDLNKVEASMLADAVDGIGAGVFFVHVDGKITYANASAKIMIGELNVVRETGGILNVFDPIAQKALDDALAAAAGGDIVLGGRGLSVPLIARNGERHVAHVLSLAAGARRQAGSNYTAVAAVFVHKAALQTPSLVEVVAQHFKLTPGELRVLFAIVEVGGIPEVAFALGLSDETVKTHLKRVFSKAGTNRQADLVKLIAGYANPLA
jgi:DNA-binding CsgD family transcriptional regulator